MTEAAIGSGVTGILFISAAGRLREAERAAAAERPSVALRLCAAILCLAAAGALAAVVLLSPYPGPTLAPQAAQRLYETGLGNPVTAVLMAYRSFDTMLEKVVLVLAVAASGRSRPIAFWGGAPGSPRVAQPEGTLVFLAQILAPLGMSSASHRSGSAPTSRAAPFRAARRSPPCG